MRKELTSNRKLFIKFSPIDFVPINKYIKTKSHITGFREEIFKSRKISKDYFFTWFNVAKDTDDSFNQGFWDFIFHIAQPIKDFLKDSHNKTILEIGHGGGRILASAARFFRYAIGVDIHNENDMVRDELTLRGIYNIKLFKTDGKSIPLENNIADVVYSFIVLQHVEKIEIFKKYIEETYRVLKSNGIAILYFGRLKNISVNKRSLFFYFIDTLYERFRLRKGYLEKPAKINESNLILSLAFVKQLVKKSNFQILKTVVSRKKTSDEVLLLGGQNGIVLRKD